MKWLFKALIWLMLLGGVGFCVLIYGVPLFMTLPAELLRAQDPSTVVTDRHGEPLRRFLVNGEEVVSAYATIPEIPTDFINATIAAEDKRYWKHNGIDYAAVFRAVFSLAEHGYQVSGASTITQQLIKITSEPSPRNLEVKFKEMVTARKLEMLRDKNWILENYINRLPYGNMRTGCRAAARGYFNKPLRDLSLAETTLLAALPNKPTRFNPYKNLPGAKERQVWILDRMVEDGYINQEECERAKVEQLVLVRGASAFRAPHAVELMVAQNRDRMIPGEVRSTLDLELQTFTEQAIDEHLNFIALHRDTSPYLHAAVVVIENETGEIRVLTGSRDYFDQNSGQVNGAWVPRSPGSALKPFTYLLALEHGFPSSTILADVPAEFATPTGVYRPVNYDRSFSGPVLMRKALGNSLNIPAVRMLEKIGGPKVLQKSLQDLGMTTLDKPASDYGLGLTIGGVEVRLLELTNAYAAMARLGIWKPYRLFPAGGETEEQTETRLFSEDACFVIADMMSDPAARAQGFGWENPLNFKKFRAAAKTGTSSDYRDAWTLGFTPEFTVGVWVGNFDNAPLDNFTGAAGAGPVFHAVMERLHQDIPTNWYVKPPSVRQIQVDPFSGKLAQADSAPLSIITELATETGLPPTTARSDFDHLGRTLLPEVYQNWLSDASEMARDRLAVRISANSDSSFQITSPLAGMVIYLDPDLEQDGRILQLSTDRASEIRWFSETLEVDQAERVAFLTPGEHLLEAEDVQSGRTQLVRFTVEDL